MLTIGDYAVHRKTGNFGKVIGYGHQMVDNVYLPTLKVQLMESEFMTSQERFVEDISSAWMPRQKQATLNS